MVRDVTEGSEVPNQDRGRILIVNGKQATPEHRTDEVCRAGNQNLHI